MKKVFIAAAVALTFMFAGNASAAACPNYKIFKVEIWTGSTYSFYRNYLDANVVINAIAANPSVSGRVRSVDSCTDRISTWSFANGVARVVR